MGTNIFHEVSEQVGTGVLMRIGARGFAIPRAGRLQFLFTYTTVGGARRVMCAEIEADRERGTYTVEISKTKSLGSKRYITEEVAKVSGVKPQDLALHLQRQAGEIGSVRPTWEA